MNLGDAYYLIVFKSEYSNQICQELLNPLQAEYYTKFHFIMKIKLNGIDDQFVDCSYLQNIPQNINSIDKFDSKIR